MIQAKPLHFHFEKVVFLEFFFFFFFFFTKILIYLVDLNHFRQYFLLICKKESISSWFWQDLCFVSDPISLVNPNNSQFCIFIDKKCHLPWVFYGFSFFKFKSFPLGFTFSVANFIWIIGKYHFPCDFDSLFQIFLKIFIFHLICKYFFYIGISKEK